VLGVVWWSWSRVCCLVLGCFGVVLGWLVLETCVVVGGSGCWSWAGKRLLGFLVCYCIGWCGRVCGFGGYSGVMSGSAEDLDRLVEFAGDGPWAGAGVVIVLGSQPDANAPHGINDEDEML